MTIALNPDAEPHAVQLRQMREDGYESFGRRVSIRTKHADKAFGMAFGNLGELSEPTLRINKPPQ